MDLAECRGRLETESTPALPREQAWPAMTAGGGLQFWKCVVLCMGEGTMHRTTRWRSALDVEEVTRLQLHAEVPFVGQAAQVFHDLFLGRPEIRRHGAAEQTPVVGHD